MKLTLEGLKDKDVWNKAEVSLPTYDISAMRKCSKKEPCWIHFGAGNIFRIFIAGIQDKLLNLGLVDKGIIAVETLGHDVIDELYTPYDNLIMGVTVKKDGSINKKIIASVAETIKAIPENTSEWERLKEVFASKSLQIVSFTITEKAYSLEDNNKKYLPQIEEDVVNGPLYPKSVIGQLTALLWHRFQQGNYPLAVVSMDNCSNNGDKLRNAVLKIACEWISKNFVSREFASYLTDNKQVSFPCSMIDKITPRPNKEIGNYLESIGIENMQVFLSKRNSYIAPFVNAEVPEYLVIEDNFPNSRPPLEKAGVYITNKETVIKTERMKVTSCLNPLHTALAIYGCLLSYTYIADEMKDDVLVKLVKQIGLIEGMKVVENPGIISPESFVNEVINERLPNKFLLDTAQRIACDTSQKIGIRFGETIKSYMEKEGSANSLNAIPLAIAGWCRYLLAIDDNGNKFTLSKDPMIEELQEKLKGITFGKIESYKGQLRSILSNENIFSCNLYKAGIGLLIEKMFVEEIESKGAVRKTLERYLN
ncbi:MAG: mannitol dehydrogenase family protein [Treponema sp.]|nr:mannitol dehydrogenase family protein [Treponema sp.]